MMRTRLFVEIVRANVREARVSSPKQSYPGGQFEAYMTWIINFSTSKMNKHKQIPNKPCVMRYSVLFEDEPVARDRIRGKKEPQFAETQKHVSTPPNLRQPSVSAHSSSMQQRLMD